MTSSAAPIDCLRKVETPEGVEIQLQVAGLIPRAAAWTLDLFLRGFGYMVLFAVLSSLGEIGVGLMLLVLFFGEWFYPVFFEVFLVGATPGKQMMGLQVVHDDGTPVGLTGSFLRNLLRFADFLPVFYGFGILTMLLHPEFKRLGDLAGGTVVVHAGGRQRSFEIPAAMPLPPPFRLTPAEQSAILELAERHAGWGEERSLELANHARGLTGKHGRAGLQALFSYANWLVGRR